MGSTFSKHPGSHLYVPTGPATTSKPVEVNHYPQYPFVMDYAPDGKKHMDPDVMQVNQALKLLNDGNFPSKMFAAVLPPDKPWGNTYGVTIWYTEGSSHCRCIGNAAHEKVAPGLYRGVSNVPKIMEWLTAVTGIGQERNQKAKTYLDLMNEHNEKVAKALDDKMTEEAKIRLEGALKDLRDSGVPLHSQQIVNWKDPQIEALKKAESEAAAKAPADVLSPFTESATDEEVADALAPDADPPAAQPPQQTRPRNKSKRKR